MDAGDEWTECFTVYGIALPTAPYVGFSAITGDVSDNHECVSCLLLLLLHLLLHLTLSLPRSTELTTPPSIISVTTYSAILSSPDQQRDKLTGSKKPGVASEGSGWGWTLTKLALFVGVVAGALYGYKMYALKQARGGGAFGSVGRSMQGFGGGLYDSKRF